MSAKTLKACRSCKALVNREVQQCPICNGTTFSDEWEGMVILLSEKSELAETIGESKPWRYAINVK
ncbi:Transcription elongation factor Spt4 [Metallosphaera sp. J1]|uniref:transcription elongation factor subunit Spt4 n=1 Tax=Metallosphaera TaxID=41980 RepID=UPI001EDFD4A0|nr:transcription elongation factor subunit Spt4 [Metallosphaera javensis (ex Hofmann et al. 2022)]MCG3107920.1 Transcription elongation factor Spt4 [Metallosphaera javensis (ex Hofmann et al. 2022)]BCS91924.1 MAG: transcription elongation factor Spt4 [Metallosphaera javensis (ex Sakai et al. 2022)]